MLANHFLQVALAIGNQQLGFSSFVPLSLIYNCHHHKPLQLFQHFEKDQHSSSHCSVTGIFGGIYLEIDFSCNSRIKTSYADSSAFLHLDRVSKLAHITTYQFMRCAQV